MGEKTVIDKYSPNYDKIVNFLYEKDDLISQLLISYYQEYLFAENNKNKKKLDYIFNLYTSNKEFYRYIQNYFDVEKGNNLFDNNLNVINKICRLYEKYEKEKLKKTKNVRWL